MLTRLNVSGFKNLMGVDIQFGPFTCIAGANGVGKSNLFDAIQFLSALADNTFIEAALAVRRSQSGRVSNVRSLFHRIGGDYDDEMSFEAEMIVPRTGVDDLGQEAEAAITFLRYKVSLAYRQDDNLPSIGALELLQEELEYINLGEAPKYLQFPHTPKWRNSVVKGRRTSPFISTEVNGENRTVKLHQDGNSGRPKNFLARTLPRTVLSTVNATESPTVLLARREMQSWRLLQLEPSSLREPDEFTTKPGLGADGSHLPVTLYYLSRTYDSLGNNGTASWLYEQVARRLSELIEDVHAVGVDRDEKRQLLTLQVTDNENTIHPARSLSDGTLRFLALAILEQDPGAIGLVCLEEPENGIHPKRIPAMLRLLEDIAVDVEEPVGLDNPLRQVIINTHSPVVVNQIQDDCLLVADLKEVIREEKRFKSVKFSWLQDTWRAKVNPEIYPVAKGKVLAYLKQVVDFGDRKSHPVYETRGDRTTRVGERTDLQPQLFINE